MPDLTETALRDMLADLLDLKDEITLKLAGKQSLSSADVQRIRKSLDPMRGKEIADQMSAVLGRYSAWSAERGIEMIDAALGGETIDKVLRVPETTADVTSEYDNSRIVTIAPDLLDEVRKLTTLSFLGQRTPDQIARKIADRFEVSMGRAETIVRTEGKRLQNYGAELRIGDVSRKAASLGIPVKRTWIHSSGAVKGFRAGKTRAAYTPRPHHKAMHGVQVGSGEKFELRNYETGDVWLVDGPHDPILPAGEVVNCYCDRSIRIDREALKVQPVAGPDVPAPTQPTPAPAKAPTPAQAQAPKPKAAPKAKTAAKPASEPKPQAGVGAPSEQATFKANDRAAAMKTEAAKALLKTDNVMAYGNRKQYGGEIVRELGLDGKPKIVPKDEYDKLPGQEYYRGVTSKSVKKAAKYATDFYSGEMFYGEGMYGDGVYAAASRDDAVGYAKLEAHGKMLRFKLDPGAKVLDHDVLMQNLWERRQSRQDILGVPFERWQHFQNDEIALLLGYDAMYVKDVGYLVLLNRTAVISDGDIGDAE